MQPITKAFTVFAVAGAAGAFVPGGPTGDRVDKLVPGALHGDIAVVSFGVASVSGDRGEPMRVLHVRETFTNRQDNTPWVIDTSAASISLGSAATAKHPAFVNSDAATLPLLVVSRGERRIADLYFPISIDYDLRYFSVTYRIHTLSHRYESTVMLGHSQHWPTREERGAEPGWGRNWWSDPSYPWAEYRHRPGRLVPRPPKQIEIIRVPRDYYEEMPAVPDDVAADDRWPRTDECNEW